MNDNYNATDYLKYRPYDDIKSNQYYNMQKKTIEKRSELIGSILAKLRLEKGYTQKEIGLMIGIAQTTYAGYETGRHEICIELLIRLADIYRVSMDYISGRYISSNNTEEHVDEEQKRIEYENHMGIEEEHELQEFREFQKVIMDDIKKRGSYNRAKKSNKAKK